MLIWSQTTIQRLSELYTFDQPQTKKEIHESYSWSLGGSWFPHRKIRPPNQHQTPNGPVLRRHSHNLFARAARETSKAKPTNWWPSMGSVPEIPISGSQTLVGWVGLCENIAGKHGSLFFFWGGGQGKRRWWWKWALRKKTGRVVSYIKPKTEREGEFPSAK